MGMVITATSEVHYGIQVDVPKNKASMIKRLLEMQPGAATAICARLRRRVLLAGPSDDDRTRARPHDRVLYDGDEYDDSTLDADSGVYIKAVRHAFDVVTCNMIGENHQLEVQLLSNAGAKVEPEDGYQHEAMVLYYKPASYGLQEERFDGLRHFRSGFAFMGMDFGVSVLSGILNPEGVWYDEVDEQIEDLEAIPEKERTEKEKKC